uniref:carboxypeptidase regulatory-like domain-containing protein n=1 Tax=Roseivirga sp. TaxID=1964215 RepID=UPI0040473623
MKLLTLSLSLFFLSLGTANSGFDQIFKTNLKITVIDDLGNIVPGAKVTIYKNKLDYDSEKNPVQETKITNNKGQVTFKKVDTIAYYVLAKKGDMDNIGAGEIITELEKGKLNKANVVISDGL